MTARVPVLVLFFLAGCNEYNLHATHSEADTLADVTRLTNGFDRAGQARLSPDLRWVVFRAIPHGEQNHQIFVARITTKPGVSGPVPAGIDRAVRITPAGSLNGPAEFSPDGFTLLFSSTAESKNPKRMRMFQVAGWEQNVSLADSARGVDLTTQMPIDVPGTDFSFSPDGKWVVFASTRDGPSRLFAIPAAGGTAVALTNGPDHTPTFSPDGKFVAFCRDRGPGSDLFVSAVTFDDKHNITGLTDETQVTHDDNQNLNPAWHPDGKHIVYATSLHGRTNYDLYLMGRDGRDKTRITFWDGADLFPSFSGDGQWLCWTSTRASDGTTQAYVARFTFPPGS
jgi:TolB protein